MKQKIMGIVGLLGKVEDDVCGSLVS